MVSRLAMEHKNSHRRIDAAVAAIMAVHRAAELAGASRPTSTSRRIAAVMAVARAAELADTAPAIYA